MVEMPAPTVSLIMPAYNAEPYLVEAVESVLGQTFTDFELIIVDDASTDATSAILDRYDDPRIVRLRNERNLGQTASMNRAIQAAKGAYLARQDADDLSMPQRLELEVAYLDSHPAVGLVGAASTWIDGKGELQRTWEPALDNASLQQELMRNNVILHGSSMFRRAAMEEAGPAYRGDMNYAQDYDFQLRIAEGWDVANLAEHLYAYRWHAGMESIKKKALQDSEAAQAVKLAVQRRLQAGWAVAIGRRTSAPAWARRASRRRLAEHCVWWSSGIRAPGNTGYALQFLAVALALDPTYRPAWGYSLGVMDRKLRRLNSRTARTD
jgi:GT2 family glycosyltransferase